MSPLEKKHIIILGAGVTGLQTAISLLTSPSTSHYQITIIASHLPGDSSLEYTSPWAGADWRSSASLSSDDAEVREWDQKTYKHWLSLLSDTNGKESMEEKEKRLGLGMRTLLYFWGKENAETAGHDGSRLWWRNAVQDFKVLDLEKEREAPKCRGAVFGIRFQSFFLNVPRYLESLLEHVKELGAKVTRRNIETGGGLAGIVRDAKLIVSSGGRVLEGNEVSVDVVALINCTGLAARKFVSTEEAEKLYPIRGQTILVKGEAKIARTYVGIPNTDDQELLYVIPRSGSRTTILGGCKQVGKWDGEVDESLSKRIMARLKTEELAEELRTGEGGEFEVVSVQVGLRPGRKGGPRVELDGNKRVEGTWVVHAYGHAGSGYQNSVGSAERVVKIVSGLD